MKKVGVFTSALLPSTETFIREQVGTLRRWQPVLIGNRTIPRGLPTDGIDVEVLSRARPVALSRLRLSLCYWLAVPDPASVAKLGRRGLALIHAHFGTNAVDIWPVSQRLGLPLIATLHGYDINAHREWWEAGHGGLRRRSYPLRLLTMAQCPRVTFIAVSHAVRESAIAAGIPEKKIHVHHIGVDTERFRPGGAPMTQRARRILFVGRLIENKGVEYLVRAFGSLRAHVRDAELVVAGDGHLKEPLRQLAMRLCVPVSFLGAISNEDVKRQLDQARVLCLPSVTLSNGTSEGFGMVLLEAQACGVPVVTSSRGARTEGLEDGHTGFVFAERDVAALARHLTFLLTNTEPLQHMSSQAVQFVRRKFDIRTCTARLEDFYETFECSAVSPE